MLKLTENNIVFSNLQESQLLLSISGCLNFC